jgi:hypothetical protein
MQLEIKGVLTEVTPVDEFKFPAEHEDGFGGLFQLTCVNHPTARWSTKNPHIRNLHFLEGPAEHPFTECDCSFFKLVVISKESE